MAFLLPFVPLVAAAVSVASTVYSISSNSKASSRAESDAKQNDEHAKQVAGVRSAQLASRTDTRSRMRTAQTSLATIKSKMESDIERRALAQTMAADTAEVRQQRSEASLTGAQGLRDNNAEIIAAAKAGELAINQRVGVIIEGVETQAHILEARGIAAGIALVQARGEEAIKAHAETTAAQRRIASVEAQAGAAAADGVSSGAGMVAAVASEAGDRLELLKFGAEGRIKGVEAALTADRQSFQLFVAHAGADTKRVRQQVNTDLIARLTKGGLINRKIAETYGPNSEVLGTLEATSILAGYGISHAAGDIATAPMSVADHRAALQMARIDMRSDQMEEKISATDLMAKAQTDMNDQFEREIINQEGDYGKQMIDLGVAGEFLATDRQREAIMLQARNSVWSSVVSTGTKLSQMDTTQIAKWFAPSKNTNVPFSNYAEGDF